MKYVRAGVSVWGLPRLGCNGHTWDWVDVKNDPSDAVKVLSDNFAWPSMFTTRRRWAVDECVMWKSIPAAASYYVVSLPDSWRWVAFVVNANQVRDR